MDVRYRNDVTTTLPLEVFTRRNFAADFFRQKLKFTGKIAKSRFVPPFGRLRGNVHGSSMARWKVRWRLPISANWTFSLALTVEALWANIGRNCAVWKGGGSLWSQISGGRGSSTNEFWRQKTRLRGLSRGVVCVILRLAVLIQYRCVTHTETDRRTHDDGYYPCIAYATRVIIKKLLNALKETLNKVKIGDNNDLSF